MSVINSLSEISFRDVLVASHGNEGLCIAFDMYTATSFEGQQRVIERAVDYSCRFLQENKHLKYNLSEDQLTVDIIGQLRAMSFDADHDTQVGGHVDILVRGKNGFLWLAESKKHGAYDWLFSGLSQLRDRYSTGVAGQDTGDLIIFCTNRDALGVMNTWYEKLGESDSEIILDNAEIDELVFRSTHKHEGSGRNVRVRHKMVVLWWPGAT